MGFPAIVLTCWTSFFCFCFLARAVQPFLTGRIYRAVSRNANSRFSIACLTANYKGWISGLRVLEGDEDTLCWFFEHPFVIKRTLN